MGIENHCIHCIDCLETPPMAMKITIYEVVKRPTYELITAAGGDRPVYVGSREWREQQQDGGNTY